MPQNAIVVINSGLKVQTANTVALTALRKELPEIENQRGGVVFECAFARLPGGCGNTVHCSGCTLKVKSSRKLETEKSFLKVPAVLHRDDPDNPDKIAFHITTEKVKDYVLLRIDEMKEDVKMGSA